ncbi:hypothetical protein Ciccas_013341 [Cichlidogyrus casuarinus]|uniref:Uncharacterized protein n=1 Tax=Cichlidogyrus casuarinus TaxID=1844966 RepID=A0ABD2PKU9_9PLAT
MSIPERTRRLTINTYRMLNGKRVNLETMDRFLVSTLTRKFKHRPATRWALANKGPGMEVDPECSLVDKSYGPPDFALVLATGMFVNFIEGRQNEQIRKEDNSFYDQVSSAWQLFLNTYQESISRDPVSRLNAICKLSIQLRNNTYFANHFDDLEKKFFNYSRRLSLTGEDIFKTLILHYILKFQAFTYLKPNETATMEAFHNMHNVIRVLLKDLTLIPNWLLEVGRMSGKTDKELMFEMRKVLTQFRAAYKEPKKLPYGNTMSSHDLLEVSDRGNEDPLEIRIPSMKPIFSDSQVEIFVWPLFKAYKDRPDLIDYDEKRFPNIRAVIDLFLASRAPVPLQRHSRTDSVNVFALGQNLLLALRSKEISSSVWNMLSVLIMASDHVEDVKELLFKDTSWYFTLTTAIRLAEKPAREVALMSVLLLLETKLFVQLQKSSLEFILPFTIRAVFTGMEKNSESCAFYLAVFQQIVSLYRCEYLPKLLVEIGEKGSSVNSKVSQHLCEMINLLYDSWPNKAWMAPAVTRKFIPIIKQLSDLGIGNQESVSMCSTMINERVLK